MALRFLHIPKTAGSTFQEILLRQYPGKGYFIFSGETRDDVVRFNSLPEHEREGVEIFLGHAPISTGLPAADTARIITFLRNPIERVKSFCQHVSEGKSPYLREEYPPESFSLDRFLNSGNEELANIHTKMLINSGNCALPTVLKDLSPAEARDLALANLHNRIFRYGLTELFDESLVLFARALNWSLPVYVPANKKDTTRLIHFEDRHLKRIAELNAIDLEVYTAAKADFLDSIRGPGFDRVKLTLLRLVNPFYARKKKDHIQSKS